MTQRIPNSAEVEAFAAASPFRQGRIGRILERLLAIDRLDEVYRTLDAEREVEEDIHVRALRELGIETEIRGEVGDRIPREGPVIVVANHPTGIADGLVLQALVRRHRGDLKFMANGLLLRYPAFGREIVPVDPFGGPGATRTNARGLKEASRWLDQGGVLGVFPSGSVAALEGRRARIEEGPWSDTVARLARRSGATVVPIHLGGANGLVFHLAGLLSRRLRTALLPHELLRKRERTIRVRIGRPIAPERIAALKSPERIIRYLRHQTMLLGEPEGRRLESAKRPQPTFLGELPVVAQAPRALRVAEFEQIERRTELARVGRLSVHVAAAPDIPELLQEIGRLRELTFRAAGEGTGHDCDVDAYDAHYLHLFAWDHERGEIAGSYRFRPTMDCEGRPEPALLYTSRLFGYDARFLARVGPAIELGRSFVRAEYQADFGTLYALWRGIGAWVARHPRYRRLIGAVSTSARYRDESRELLVSYLTQRHVDHGYAELVTPRTPFTTGASRSWSPGELGRLADHLDEVSAIIEELEPGGEGVPVLWRHYLKLGARIAAFSVDGNFGNVVDGLIVVDLDETPMRHLQRYMGSECAKIFRGRSPKPTTPTP